MNGIFYLLSGFYRITFCSEHPEKILNFALKQNIPIREIKRKENSVSFSVSPRNLPRFERFLSDLKEGESYQKKEGGILRFFCLFRKRFGLFLGFFLFLFAIFLSSRFVWGVEIFGNEEITSEEIREKLSEAGLKPGKRIAKIDADSFSLLFQIKNPEFSFVNLNFIGTKAMVEVREREKSEKSVPYEGATNQVASIWGTVVRVEVFSGQSEVKKGDVVTEGALLISGVREKKNGSFSAVRAQGRVFAQTERSTEIFVPLLQKESVFTGREKRKKVYEFLGIPLSFSLFGKAPFSSYQTIRTEESAELFGLEIPIRIQEVIFLEIKEKNGLVELDRARNLAYDKYEEFKRETFASDTEFLEEKIEISEREEGVFLTAEISAVENICKEVPFSVISSS